MLGEALEKMGLTYTYPWKCPLCLSKNMVFENQRTRLEHNRTVHKFYQGAQNIGKRGTRNNRFYLYRGMG